MDKSLVGQYIFWSIFVLINIYIIYNDICKKLIPNKSIVSLFLLALLGFLLMPTIVFSWIFLLGYILTLLICFTLFYYSIWGAGDAKYILALSLFLPSGGITYTIGYIAFFIFGYLITHFMYLYILQPIFSPSKTKKLVYKIYQDIHEKIKTSFHKNQVSNNYYDIFIWLLEIICSFLILFTCIRLARIYIVNYLISHENGGSSRLRYIVELGQEYNIYMAVIVVVIFITVYKYMKKYITLLFSYIQKKSNIPQKKIKLYSLLLCTSILIIFIVFEYAHNPIFISESLVRIFTFFIVLWFIIKILLYLYHVTFQLNEVVYKHINDLKPGDIVEKDFLIKIFGSQKTLGYGKKKGKYAPNPSTFFSEMDNPINTSLCKELKTIYTRVNNYHLKQQTSGFEKIEAVKTMKTFAFAPYIFGGAIMSLLFGDTIIQKIFNLLFTHLGNL